MSVTTIDRSALGTDDDGTATTGTAVDTAYIAAAIYDKIDALLNAALNLTGPLQVIAQSTGIVVASASGLFSSSLTAGIAILSGHAGGQTLAAGATKYLSFGGSNDTLFATIVAAQTPMPVAGKISNIFIFLTGTQPASGSLAFSVIKNSTDVIDVTDPAGSTGNRTISHIQSIAFAQADGLCLRVINNATDVSAQILGFAVAFSATN